MLFISCSFWSLLLTQIFGWCFYKFLQLLLLFQQSAYQIIHPFLLIFFFSFFLLSHSYLYINALYSISSATIACLLLLIHSVQCFHRPSPRHSNWPCYILWLSWCCSFSVLFVNLDSLSSFYYLGYCPRSHSYLSFLLLSYFVRLVTTYVLNTFYFIYVQVP